MSPDNTSTSPIKEALLLKLQDQDMIGIFKDPRLASSKSIYKLCLVLFVFTSLAGHVSGTIVVPGQKIRAAGGVPGPPAQAGHGNPKKEGQNTPLVSPSDFTTSTITTASTFPQQSSTTTAVVETSTPNIAFSSTLTPILSASNTLPSFSMSQQSILPTVMTFTLSSSTNSNIASTLPPTTTSSSAVDSSSTIPSSSAVATSAISSSPVHTLSSLPVNSLPGSSATIPTMASSIPTTTALMSTGQSTEKRNLTIALPTVFLSIAFAIVTTMLLRRYCTRRPQWSILCLTLRAKTNLRIPDEEIPPSLFEKPQTATGTERAPQNAIPSPLPPPSPVAAPSFASTKSFIGITLPSRARFSPVPFSPLRSHPPCPPQQASRSTPTASFGQIVPRIPRFTLFDDQEHSRASLAASSSAVSSKSSRSSRVMEESEAVPAAAVAAARFTFGGRTAGGGAENWRVSCESGERNGGDSEMEVEMEVEKTGADIENKKGDVDKA